MTSVQERLQLKRMALDKWSIREQLCLASAVYTSGDQNWMSVSRSLKMLCGSNRPPDWFSQKSCAVQYGDLLENVETPKRKKRTDCQTAETPTESILRKLTQERIAELKKIMLQEQEEYVKLRNDILNVQNGSADEEALREMWSDIEKDREQKESELQKYNEWLKEREEKKIEMQRAWRPGIYHQNKPGMGGQPPKPTHLAIMKQKSDDVDEEESGKVGTSPLLTSLLKSTSPAPGGNINLTTVASGSSPISARATAPTITNLLTGNSSSPTGNPNSINANAIQSFHHIQNQPLSGPIPVENLPAVLKSPSQAAPTLSMLLENKHANKSQTSNIEATAEIKVESSEDAAQLKVEEMETEECDPGNKDEEQQLMEVFEDLIPDNIDELAEILTNNNAINFNSELLEEESILENVESLINEQEQIDDKSGIVIKEAVPEPPKNLSGTPIGDTKIKEEPIEENTEPNISEIKQETSQDETETHMDTQISETEPEEKSDGVEAKSQTKISDDSTDNTCLQTLKQQLKEDDYSSDVEEKLIENTAAGPKETIHSKEITVIESSDSNEAKDETVFDIKTESSVTASNSEIIEINEDDDTNDKKSVDIEIKDDESQEKSISDNVDSVQGKDSNEMKPEKTEIIKMDEQPSEAEEKLLEISTGILQDTTPQPILEVSTTINIIDTDDDSPIEVIKEDKVGKAKRDYSRKKPDPPVEKKSEEFDDSRSNLSIRKLKDRDRSESPLVDDENPESLPRTRRRYSSTPVIDSIPNSPASSDDREYKAWKKSILMAYNRLSTHKYASVFLRPVTEDVAPNYRSVVYRPMDLQTIKKNIESGVIRTTFEFQRDVMLMCHNAIMFNKKDNNIYSMAKELMADSIVIIENVMEGLKKESEKTFNLSLPNSKIRSRKSHRLP